MVVPLFFLVSPEPNEADKIIGWWTDEGKTRIIEFVKNGDEYEAILRSAEQQDVIGGKLITGLRSDGKNRYHKGTIHLVKGGRTADCSVKFISETQIELKASIGKITRIRTWTRTKK
jgi:uncharacterized protein (DUF2147 family)